MSSSQTPARLAVRSVDDLVGLVPYLIGFHPRESLVAIVLREGRVEVTARVDLEAVACPDGLAYLVEALFSRFPDAEAWFLAYSDDAEAAWDVLAGCAALSGVIRLARVIQVGADQWRADDPEGETGPVRVSAAGLQAAVLGLTALASREELEARVAGPGDDEVGELCELFERVATEVAELDGRSRRRLLTRLVRRGGGRCRADWVRLAVLVADPDAALGQLAALRPGAAEHLVAVWTQVVRHCLVPYLPTPLGLLGMAAWLTGDGAMTTVCLERIGRLHADHPLAALLDHIVSDVLPPSQWPAQRAGLVAATSSWFDESGWRCE